MEDKDKKPKFDSEEEKIEVPMSTLVTLQESLARMEKEREDDRAKMAGLEELFASQAPTEGVVKLKKKNTFEPKFRTVRIRQFPIAGDYENQGYIIGWTNRGAYQEVDRSGVSPQIVDFIDVIFLGQEKTPEGKIKAEKVKLLDLFNKGTQVHCKIIKTERNTREEATGEEIDVATYDPQHGLVSNGEKVDGFVTFSDVVYTIQIPGVEGEVVIDSTFVN